MTIFIVLIVVAFIVYILLDRRVSDKIKSSLAKLNENIKNNRKIKKETKQNNKPVQKRIDTDVIPDKSKLRIENKATKIDLEDSIENKPNDSVQSDDAFMDELDDLIKEIYFDGDTNADSKTTINPPKNLSLPRKTITDFDNLYDSEFSDDSEVASIYDKYSATNSSFAKKFRALPKEMQILMIGDVLKRKYY